MNSVLTRLLASVLISLLLPGCAGLATSTKAIDLRGGSVAIDVKQRVVFSSPAGAPGATVVCAEPSPDALTVIGATGGLSVSDRTGQGANAAFSMAESGSFVGLRTQSIQLLRDAMYRLCEGYAGRAVTSADFAAMQRRYQSTMMGLIAIEQLTGPVVAAQAMLAANASTQAGASAGDAAVDAAQSRVTTANEALLNAQTNLDTAQTKLEQSRAEIKVNEDSRKAESSKKPPDQTILDSLAERLRTLSTEERSNRDEVTDKRRRLASAEKALAEAKADVERAKSRVSASATTGGSLGEVARASQGASAELARAVTTIVVEINRSYSKDGCLALVTELVKDPVSVQRLLTAGASPSQARVEQLAVAEQNLRMASEQWGKLASAEVSANARLKAAVTPEARVDAEAASIQANAALKIAQSRLVAAEDDVKRLRAELAESGNSLEVLRTSLAVCQRILAEEQKGLAQNSPDARRQ